MAAVQTWRSVVWVFIIARKTQLALTRLMDMNVGATEASRAMGWISVSRRELSFPVLLSCELSFPVLLSMLCELAFLYYGGIGEC